MTKKGTYISGTWDLFHIGHLNVLRQAKNLGGLLIVGVNTDEFTYLHKGRSSIIPFEERCVIIEAIKYVDFVVPHKGYGDVSCFEEHSVTKRVVCEEYTKNKNQRGCLTKMQELGINVVVIPRTLSVSSTLIRNKIKNG